MPGQHALLSPSAAHRWMNCPVAPRLEATVPEETSPYAEEGTLAHAFCAMKLKKAIGQDYTPELQEIDELCEKYYTGEMDEYTDSYAATVLGMYNEAMRETADARLLVEIRLDFSEYVPESFGTSDAAIIADGTMDVIDFKYGKGVPVSAVRNEQMMIYALGAYLEHGVEYDIDTVRMTIIQPRLDNISTYMLSVSELLQWSEEELKPGAARAYLGAGEAKAGEWCRFCAVKNRCKALADTCTGLQECADGKLYTPDELAAKVLPKLAMVKAWASSVEAYALQQALEGVRFKGYKLVEGRSVRRITDESAVAGILDREGYDPREYMTPARLAGLGDLEKLVGKKPFAVLCSDYITRPQGKPTLVESADKRPEYCPGDDFKDIDID